LYLAERLDGGIVDMEVLEAGLNRIVRVATDDDPLGVRSAPADQRSGGHGV
jgi:hypothetical protein